MKRQNFQIKSEKIRNAFEQLKKNEPAKLKRQIDLGLTERAIAQTVTVTAPRARRAEIVDVLGVVASVSPLSIMRKPRDPTATGPTLWGHQGQQPRALPAISAQAGG